ncbi:hypothetical protein [Streptomyces sp. 900105245]
MSEKLFAHTDASGKVTTAIYHEKASASAQHFVDFPCSVEQDMVTVGGGATAALGPGGALLTASYPNASRSAWLASSKDHLDAYPHQLEVFAIGMKIQGLSRSELLGHLWYQRADSSIAAAPSAAVGLQKDFVLISGGFCVNYGDGAGNLATASCTENGSEWVARSKDHVVSSPCRITTFAIGLRRNMPNIGVAVPRYDFCVSNEVIPWPTAEVALNQSFALTGIGGKAITFGSGQLLWSIAPTHEGTKVSSKDHRDPSPGGVAAFALGVGISI